MKRKSVAILIFFTVFLQYKTLYSQTPAPSVSPTASPTPVNLVCRLEPEYSTYLGGSGGECPEGIAVDSGGCAYIAGPTDSRDFPTQNPYHQTHFGGTWDTFVTKFSSSGSSLVYSTYIGGTNSDYCFGGLVIDSLNCAYIVGATRSSDFPTRNPFQATLTGKADAFITKISFSGSDLVFSTYLGGSANEWYDGDTGHGIAIDSADCVFVIGMVQSDDFPTKNPYQASRASDVDAFVTKFSSSGSTLVFSTFLGGGGSDDGDAIAVDSIGNVYVTGNTRSGDFPLQDPYQATKSVGQDAFITKLSSCGSRLSYSTYFGAGYEYDNGCDIKVDSAFCAYFFGLPFNAKFSSSGSCLLFSFGSGASGALDLKNKIYVSSGTDSPTWPLMNPYQPTLAGDWDAFVSVFSSSGNELVCGTYWGGTAFDYVFDIAIDLKEAVYIAGETKSPDFPTLNSYQSSYAGRGGYPTYYGDAFVSKFKWVCHLTTPSPIPTPTPPARTVESGDYNGDGKSEISIFRPSERLWAIKGLGRIYFGGSGDIPVSGDYDGDGISDVAVYRPASGLWAIKNVNRLSFGGPSDIPLPRDYDGDGSCDIAIFDGGWWNVRDLSSFYYGTAGDIPVPEDYDGDGLVEAAIFRPSSGLWAIRELSRVYFGNSGDIPLPDVFIWYGERTEQGPWKAQIAISRPARGLWAVKDRTRFYFGSDGDIPITADFDGDALAEPAVFRPSSGLWSVRNLTRCWFGGSDDLPVSK